MNNANKRLAQLMIVVLVAGAATLLAASSVGGQSSSDSSVPVDFESSGLSPVQLHFWRQGDQTCDINATAAPAGGASTPEALCQMRAEPPQQDSDNDPKSETRFIRSSTPTAGDQLNESSVVRFALDTVTTDQDSGLDATAQGARHPFTIDASSSAVQITFHYDSEAVCDETTGGPQPLDFHIRLRKGTPEDPLANSPISKTVKTACGTPGDDLDSGDADRVSATIGLDKDVTVKRDQILITEIFAVSQELSGVQSNLQWSIFFQDDDFDSRISVRTDEVVENAVWATDNSGTVRNTFNPDAPESERFLVPQMALRSPFGDEAFPAQGYTAEIVDPSGGLVDLIPGGDQDSSLAMDELEDLRKRNGSLKVFKITKPSGEDQPWHYDDDVETGSYEIRVNGKVLGGRSLTVSQGVAMGAFAFDMGPVDQESTTHRLKKGTSTTFLLELVNDAPEDATFQVEAQFEFSEGGAPWSVDLIGTDQNNRLSVPSGDNGLLRVQVTPPDDVSIGDRARVLVQAESLASGAIENVTVEAQVSDQTIRDVGVLVVREEPIPVRLDETTQFTVFAWNQGTATDSIHASIVPNSSETAKPNAFEAALAQADFPDIAPGSVESIPVEVTTTRDSREGDKFSFQVEAHSRADSAVSATERVETIVEAQRSIAVLGLDHQNGESLESFRWASINRTDDPGTPANECQPGDSDDDTDTPECNDWANWTYHRIMVTNTGDQPETVDLSLAPGGDEPGRLERTRSGPNDPCTRILPDRMKFGQTGIVDRIAHDSPGSESTIDQVEVQPGQTRVAYLRVAFDGWTPYYQDLGPTQEACEAESYHATVAASIPGQTKRLSTETRFPLANTPNMPAGAQGRLALEDRYVDSGEDVDPPGRLVELPRFVGVEPGETTTINFTLSLQQAHEDRGNVTIATEDLAEDLIEDGWDIKLKSLDTGANVSADERTLSVPASDKLGPRANRSIGHTTGADYKLGLEVSPPESGLQENQRFVFTMVASSEERPEETDSTEVGVQIGKNFGFSLDQGNRTIDAHPGDEIAFSLGIQNDGATRDGYRVVTNSSGANVDVDANPEDLRISSGSRKVSAVHVAIPSGASQNSQAEIGANVFAERGTPEDGSDDIGPRTVDYTVDIKPPSTLTMDAETPVISVSPGGRTAMNFSITNQKDTPQNLEVSQVIGPPDWQTSLARSNESVRIGGGETITQTVLVEAPDSIVEGSRFPFVMQAQNTTDSGEFAVALAEVTVQGQTAISLETEANETQVVDRGDVAEYPLLVRNPGTSPTNYELRASFESEGWSAQFVDPETDTVLSNRTIRVAETQFRRVVLEVQAPNQVPEGHVEGISVRAFAQGQRSVEDTASLTAEIHEFGVDIDVTGATAKDAAPGDAVPFQVDITNTGNGQDEIRLDFKGPENEDPLYPVTTQLSDQTTPTLEAGETLRNVTVEVQIPSPRPNQAPIPTDEGVTTVIQAQSVGASSNGAPTASTEVTTRLVEYVMNDVDDDTAFEVALDLNRDLSDGYEVFRDQDAQLIERDELNSTQAVSATGLYVIDADDDGRAEHLIDTDNDGAGDIYFDPDRARKFSVPYTVDVNDDAQAEHPVDANFDGLIDAMYDPGADAVRKAVQLDFSGDGRDDLLVDSNGDTFFDRFVDPHEDPPLVTPVERDGDLYKVDTTGDDQVDTHYDVETQSIQDAESANLQNFLGDYWYVIVVFLAVVVAFGVIFYRQL